MSAFVFKIELLIAKKDETKVSKIIENIARETKISTRVKPLSLYLIFKKLLIIFPISKI
jgi:hypothetical protein